MIYLIYFVVATLVVLLSIKAAYYVDLIDKTTNLSGAFIGGVLLSAVTSLPELLTSISATMFFDNSGLALGNILGSNIFNLTTLSILILFSFSTFKKSKVSISHKHTAVYTLIIYTIIILNMYKILDLNILTVSCTSIFILIIYVLGVKSMINDNSEKDMAFEEIANDTVTEEECSLTLKQIIIRFIFTSIGLVIASISITYVTDIISVRLNMSASLVGALLLGIATSLPEVSSSISLVRMGNFNVTVGNIVGSNLFNFLILFVVDVLYIKGSIYNFGDKQSKNLLFFGMISTILMIVILKSKKEKTNRYIIIGSALGVVISYIMFLSI